MIETGKFDGELAPS